MYQVGITRKISDLEGGGVQDLTPPTSYDGVCLGMYGDTLNFRAMTDIKSYIMPVNKAEPNNVSLDLYFIENVSNLSTLAEAKDVITSDLIKKGEKLTVPYTRKNGGNGQDWPVMINTQLPDLIQANYIVCEYSMDSCENETYAPIGFINRAQGKKEVKISKVETNEYTISLPKETSDYTTFYSLQYFDNASSKWIDVVSGQTVSEEAATVTNSNLAGKFVRIFKQDSIGTTLTPKATDTLESDNKPTYFSKYTYLYAGIASDYHTGNIIEGMNGYTVFTYGSEPCLVEVLHSSRKYEDKNSWEFNTLSSQRKNPKILQNGESYQTDLTNVPSKDWYIVLFHFANGTNVMTDPTQKP